MSGHEQAQRIRRAFHDRFGEPALVVRGPGRVNLIGEHTDYNLGFVLPAAVDKSIWLALRPRQDDVCRFLAADTGESFETTLPARASSGRGWPDYLLGVYAEMADDARTPSGVDCVFGGDLPIGSGMSSSAALECGFAFGLNTLFELGYDRVSLARLGQRAEHRFAGVHCGIMDQFASLLGREGHVVRLDCRDLDYAYLPLDDAGLAIVLCDSHVRRALAASGVYNARRAECDAGVACLRARHPEVQSLRDVTLAMLEDARSALPAAVYARCAFVVRENHRVLEVCEALAAHDHARVGHAMNESHRGLQSAYEVSCAELDLLADGARAVPGVFGSRMMGAGLGGCTINLVADDALPDFEARMAEIYARDLRAQPLIHVCRPAGGTEVVP